MPIYKTEEYKHPAKAEKGNKAARYGCSLRQGQREKWGSEWHTITDEATRRQGAPAKKCSNEQLNIRAGKAVFSSAPTCLCVCVYVECKKLWRERDATGTQCTRAEKTILT